MDETLTLEQPAAEVNTQATEAAVEQPTPANDQQQHEPKTLPWEPTAAQIMAGQEFIGRCISEGLTPHPRGVYQTMFAALQE